MNAAGVILAGGKSFRMGRDKALLLIKNKPLIKLIADELSDILNEILIVSNHQAKYALPGIREIADIYTGKGPLGGIHSALVHTNKKKIFVTACDMPFVKGELAKLILEQSEGCDVTVPFINNYLEPLFAVYDKSCLPYIEKNLINNNNKITELYSEVKVNYVREEMIKHIVEPAKVFVNINYPQEYKEFSNKFLKKKLSQKKKGVFL